MQGCNARLYHPSSASWLGCSAKQRATATSAEGRTTLHLSEDVGGEARVVVRYQEKSAGGPKTACQNQQGPLPGSCHCAGIAGLQAPSPRNPRLPPRSYYFLLSKKLSSMHLSAHNILLRLSCPCPEPSCQAKLPAEPSEGALVYPTHLGLWHKVRSGIGSPGCT